MPGAPAGDEVLLGGYGWYMVGCDSSMVGLCPLPCWTTGILMNIHHWTVRRCKKPSALPTKNQSFPSVNGYTGTAWFSSPVRPFHGLMPGWCPTVGQPVELITGKTWALVDHQLIIGDTDPFYLVLPRRVITNDQLSNRFILLGYYHFEWWPTSDLCFVITMSYYWPLRTF